MTGSPPGPAPPRRGGPGPLRFAGLGVQLAASVLGLALLGQWVDRRIGTSGLFAVLGAFVGFAASMISLLRELGAGKDGRS